MKKFLFYCVMTFIFASFFESGVAYAVDFISAQINAFFDFDSIFNTLNQNI